jgi:hypothetical protein
VVSTRVAQRRRQVEISARRLPDFGIARHGDRDALLYVRRAGLLKSIEVPGFRPSPALNVLQQWEWVTDFIGGF